MKKKKITYTLGDVIVIPLGETGFGYARMYSNCDFGVYDLITQDIVTVDQVINCKILFIQNGVDSAVCSGQWPIIGNHPFNDPEEAFAPPRATCYLLEFDKWTMGGPKISHKGKTLSASADEVKGMDILSVFHRPELMVTIIIDRVIHRNHAAYQVKS